MWRGQHVANHDPHWCCNKGEDGSTTRGDPNANSFQPNFDDFLDGSISEQGRRKRPRSNKEADFLWLCTENIGLRSGGTTLHPTKWKT